MQTFHLQNLLVFFGAILLTTFGLIGYDIFMGVTYGVQATISYSMNWFGSQYPVMPYLLGLLVASFVVGLGVHFWGAL